ncbi:MAG: type VI secretion system baseplate subunit TssE [Desulfovibrionaceae bacterium]|nr:type VI secretion system baseplate subunit TssE [Desulfovibrionaceae bacterium]
MENKRLLERIREMAGKPRWRGNDDIETIQESILTYLNKLLNTRQGSAIVADNFGIPDFSALAASFNRRDVSAIENSIQEVVSRYEKRLKNIRVTFEENPDDPLTIAFHMEGDLVGTSEPTSVCFQTVLAQNGFIIIKKDRIEENS